MSASSPYGMMSWNQQQQPQQHHHHHGWINTVPTTGIHTQSTIYELRIENAELKASLDLQKAQFIRSKANLSAKVDMCSSESNDSQRQLVLTQEKVNTVRNQLNIAISMRDEAIADLKRISARQRIGERQEQRQDEVISRLRIESSEALKTIASLRQELAAAAQQQTSQTEKIESLVSKLRASNSRAVKESEERQKLAKSLDEALKSQQFTHFQTENKVNDIRQQNQTMKSQLEHMSAQKTDLSQLISAQEKKFADEIKDYQNRLLQQQQLLYASLHEQQNASLNQSSFLQRIKNIDERLESEVEQRKSAQLLADTHEKTIEMLQKKIQKIACEATRTATESQTQLDTLIFEKDGLNEELLKHRNAVQEATARANVAEEKCKKFRIDAEIANQKADASAERDHESLRDMIVKYENRVCDLVKQNDEQENLLSDMRCSLSQTNADAQKSEEKLQDVEMNFKNLQTLLANVLNPSSKKNSRRESFKNNAKKFIKSRESTPCSSSKSSNFASNLNSWFSDSKDTQRCSCQQTPRAFPLRVRVARGKH